MPEPPTRTGSSHLTDQRISGGLSAQQRVAVQRSIDVPNRITRCVPPIGLLRSVPPGSPGLRLAVELEGRGMTNEADVGVRLAPVSPRPAQ
jgi:hypothetical protein